jgi:tRNA(Ile)-lysidine synthase
VRSPADAWLRGALLQRHIRRLDPTARDFDAHRIAAELDSVKRMSVTKHLELIRKGDALILRRRLEPAEEFEVALTANRSAYIEALDVTVHVRQPATGNRQQIQLPPGADPAFTVRNRRKGDRFHPLGLPSPKKLKDFLIDRKIDADVRDRLPLLVWNGEIVWIAGVEVSERFRVTGADGVLCEVWTDDGHQAGLQR